MLKCVVIFLIGKIFWLYFFYFSNSGKCSGSNITNWFENIEQIGELFNYCNFKIEKFPQNRKFWQLKKIVVRILPIGGNFSVWNFQIRQILQFWVCESIRKNAIFLIFDWKPHMGQIERKKNPFHTKFAALWLKPDGNCKALLYPRRTEIKIRSLCISTFLYLILHLFFLCLRVRIIRGEGSWLRKPSHSCFLVKS